MFHFLCKKPLQNPTLQKLPIHLLQNPSLKSLSQTTPPPSLIQYLTDSCFLSPAKALSVAKTKRVQGKTPKDPDSILTLLKNHGFSKTHIQNLISKRPDLLFIRDEAKLREKMEFFKERGLSDSVIADYFSTNPTILSYSLENRIKPVFDFIASISGTHESLPKMPRRSTYLFGHSLDKKVVPNVTLLQNFSVPNSRISRLVMAHPGLLTLSTDRFREIVKLVKEMGFHPSTHRFMEAVRAMGALSRSTWERKFETYRSLGWSDEEILTAFRRHPGTILKSEEKIRKGMDFFMKELGWNPSFIAPYSTILNLSLEKRIMPRHNVLQVLKSMGLVKKSLNPVRVFLLSEKQFLEDYLFSHGEMVPELLKVYQGEVGYTAPDVMEGETSEVR